MSRALAEHNITLSGRAMKRALDDVHLLRVRDLFVNVVSSIPLRDHYRTPDERKNRQRHVQNTLR